MTSPVMTIKIEGAEELAARLGKFGDGTADLTTGLKDSSDYLTGFFAGEVFASQGAVYGQKWKALSPAYAKWKAKKFPGRTILIQKTPMIRSFRSKVAPLQATIFNTDPKFKYHQLGLGNMPQRLMMQLDEQRQRKVVGFIQSDVDAQMEKAGV